MKMMRFIPINAPEVVPSNIPLVEPDAPFPSDTASVADFYNPGESDPGQISKQANLRMSLTPWRSCLHSFLDFSDEISEDEEDNCMRKVGALVSFS